MENQKQKIKTILMLNDWGLKVQPNCILCGGEHRTISHLFFNSKYTRFLLIKMIFLNQAIWKITNTTPPTPTFSDIRLGRGCRHRWGFPKVYIQITSMAHLVTERHRRLKQHILRPPETLLQEIILSSSLSFRA